MTLLIITFSEHHFLLLIHDYTLSIRCAFVLEQFHLRYTNLVLLQLLYLRYLYLIAHIGQLGQQFLHVILVVRLLVLR